MTKPSILVRLASLAVILGSLFGATPPLAQAADDVGAAPDAPHGVTVFNVDRADDASITACTSAPDDCTLRGAINKVNTGTLVDASIYFLLSVSQVNLGAPLPALIVTGTTVYGNVLINGAGLSTGSMMTIDASQVDIGGLSFINGATRDISVLSGSENEIFGVYSGAPDDDVNACLSPGVTRTSTVGIYVGPAVTGDNTTPSLWISNNRINCHALYGIQLDGADGVIIGVNRISGAALPNRIGTDSQGDALGNDGIGIALLANGSNGAKNNQIRNNWIYNSGSQGILLRGTGTNNTNSTATNAITGNRVRGNGRLVAASGIRLMDGAFWNVIGGSAAEDKNYIYRNTGDGIRIENSELNGVLGNIIGGSPSLTGNNTANGVLIDGGQDNWIGGFFILLGSSQAGNEIGGNDGDGIHLRNGARNTKITRNLIGSDSSGVPRPNNNGISILSGSYSTTIGTSNFSDLNVVSGNTLDGIRIDGSTTTSNTIRLNDIGLITNSSGEGCPCPVPNGGFGLVAQNNAHHNRLDGGNYIAHNLSGGVAVLTGAHDNTFGPDPGSGLPEDEIFANAGSGIVFTSGRWNQVRFASIYSNTRDGIEQWSTASDNSWIGTTTYLNGGLGIDIATVANDNIPTAGYPVITSVVRAGGVVTVSGTSAGSNLTNFPVAYYVSTVYLFRDGLDPSGYGEGRTLVGSANTNLSGVWRITYVEGATPRCHAAYSRYVERDVFLGLIADRGSEFSRSTCGPAYVPMVRR